MLMWVDENISSSDLILNDYSYPSLFLTSFSLKNITSHQHLDTPENYQRAKDSSDFWKNPDDYLSFLELAKKYSIEYVLVTSVSGYKDWFGQKDYVQKPFGSKTKTVFDENPYVKLVYVSGLSAVYVVNIPTKNQ